MQKLYSLLVVGICVHCISRLCSCVSFPSFNVFLLCLFCVLFCLGRYFFSKNIDPTPTYRLFIYNILLFHFYEYWICFQSNHRTVHIFTSAKCIIGIISPLPSFCQLVYTANRKKLLLYLNWSGAYPGFSKGGGEDPAQSTSFELQRGSGGAAPGKIYA